MSTPQVKGHSSYDLPAPLGRRLLALATDLPTYLLAPVLGVLVLGAPPIPDAPVFAAWAAWAVGIHWLQRLLRGQTLGEQLWGLKSVARAPGEATRLAAQSASQASFRLRAASGLALSLVIAGQMVSKTLEFHPMLREAQVVQIPAFSPAASDPHWSVLPFYLAVGAFPKSWNESPVWYQLPYAKGPPERFPARVVLRLAQSDARITLEGPRTPEALRGRRDWVRACLTDPRLSVRLAAQCLGLRRELLLRHSREMRPGGHRPQSWGLYWFEVDNPQLAEESRAMGVYLKAQEAEQGEAEIHRFILLASDGQAQTITLEMRSGEMKSSSPALAPEMQMMFQVLGSLSLHPTLAGSRSWADRRLSETKLAEIMRRSEIGPLGELAALLVAKTTVSPRSPEAFYHLAGVSLLLLKKSAKTPAAELVSAVAKPQVLAASRYFADVAPDDPRNRALEQMVLEMKQFR